MASEWTLELIRVELDNLPLGCDFILAADDTARLVGMSGTAQRRNAAFAATHGCRAVIRDGQLIFQKRFPARMPEDAPDRLPAEAFPPSSRPPGGACDDFPSANCR